MYVYILIAGTDEERGIIKWRNQLSTCEEKEKTHSATYDIPYIMPFLRKYKCFSYIPFLPTFQFESNSIFGTCCKKTEPTKKTDNNEKYLGIPESNSKGSIVMENTL